MTIRGQTSSTSIGEFRPGGLTDQQADQFTTVPETRLQTVVAVYNTQRDSRVRLSHAALEGRQWKLGDPEMLVPPIDYNCRCYLTYHATNSRTAKRLGLPRAPRPARNAKESIDKFLRTADSRRGRRRGRLQLEDITSKKTAQLVEEGRLSIDDVLDDGGRELPSTVVEGMADKTARQRAQVQAAAAELRDQGLSLTDVRSIRGLARAEIADASGPRQAINRALREFEPDDIPGLTRRQQAARRRRIGTLLERVIGGQL